MSDNIPFEIQMEIIKWLPLKPLIQFRSVSKPWKSFIDSSEFIKGYGARNTQPHSRILSYTPNRFMDEPKYICLVDDDNNETFKVQQHEFAPFVMSPLLKEYFVLHLVGACHGLLCFYGFHEGYKNWMAVIWNPSIGKSFGIVLPFSRYVDRTPTVVNRYPTYCYGFGVCPVNRDPTVVKILCANFFRQAISCANNMPWHVEVFTLSSGVWNVIPSNNLLPPSIGLCPLTQIVIDRFIYWVAIDGTFVDALCHDKYMVVSFDLITKKFKRVDLPDSLMLREQNLKRVPVSLSKLRGSLVVYGSINVEGAKCCDVWVMEHDLSFRKLFTIGARVSQILGFRKNGEPIFETTKEEDKKFSTLDVYDPCSQQISYLGIDGEIGTFFMGSYKESLLLLDHSDLHIYGDDN